VHVFGDRNAPFMLSFDAIWRSSRDDGANIEWARAAWSDLQRYGTGRMYLNFPGHGEGDDLVQSALSPDIYAKWPRSSASTIRMNQNILPA
jgi:hypothetical protein